MSKRMFQRVPASALAGFFGVWSLGLSGCGAPDATGGEAEEVRELGQPLFLAGAKWPNGIVPVCWDASATTHPKFATASRQVRDGAHASWPSVANIEFTGWGTCGSSAPGAIRIFLRNGGGGSSQLGFSASGISMTLGADDSQLETVVTPHEFGHALGFHHEMVRSDFVDDAPGPDPNADCNEGNVSGDAVGTAPDRASIMAARYCNSSTGLTNWDAVGARNAYGPRVNGVSPIVTGWSNARGDHASVATAAGIAAVNASGYSWAYVDGWLFNSQVPGTVPLKLFWHAGRGDNFSTATAAGEQSAIAAGYTFVRIEGFVFSIAQGSATLPLKLYWHAGRADNMLTTSASGETAAIAAGYSFVRTEGHAPRSRPYSLAWTYWHGGREDNLVTAQASQLAVNAHDAGYAFAGFDGAIFNAQFQGTVPLRTYWSGPRADHFALGTIASEQAALAAGYTFVQNEGFVYPNAVSGTSAVNSFFHAGRGDHFTTISRSSIAIGSGYSLVRSEGFGLGIND